MVRKLVALTIRLEPLFDADGFGTRPLASRSRRVCSPGTGFWPKAVGSSIQHRPGGADSASCELSVIVEPIHGKTTVAFFGYRESEVTRGDDPAPAKLVPAVPRPLGTDQSRWLFFAIQEIGETLERAYRLGGHCRVVLTRDRDVPFSEMSHAVVTDNRGCGQI